jgi:hypothetical protein
MSQLDAGERIVVIPLRKERNLGRKNQLKGGWSIPQQNSLAGLLVAISLVVTPYLREGRVIWGWGPDQTNQMGTVPAYNVHEPRVQKVSNGMDSKWIQVRI